MTTKALAKFTAELCYEKLSAHSIEMAKKCLLDWLGIAIRGSQEKPVRIIHDVILQGDAPQANIFGSLPAKKAGSLKVPPDKKTSWGKRERYSFGYAVFLILALMK